MPAPRLVVLLDLKPSEVLSEAAFHNGVVTVLALGGSTNAIVHLLAMARRAGVKLDLDASTGSRARRRCSPTSGPRAST